jgi:hypothetical protein
LPFAASISLSLTLGQVLAGAADLTVTFCG